jgi:hypothetical protein
MFSALHLEAPSFDKSEQAIGFHCNEELLEILIRLLFHCVNSRISNDESLVHNHSSFDFNINSSN